ncbi:MAG: hypothetical protein AB7I19_16175 [Planctomycetota bacterium]
MKPIRLATALASFLLCTVGRSHAQSSSQSAVLVIRSDESLMTLSTESVRSFLSSQRLENLGAPEGVRLSAEVFTQDVAQPPGVFVGTLSIRFEPSENGSEAPPVPALEVLERVGGVLEAELRARLEAAPLRRLQIQRDALVERLNGVAARRRATISESELAARRERLEQDRTQCANDLARLEIELASDSAAHRRFEDEMERLTILVKAGQAPNWGVDSVKAEIAKVGTRIQQTMLSIDLAKKRMADCDARAQQLRESVAPGEDSNLLAAEFDRVAQSLARVEDRIAAFRPFEFELWR